MTDPFGTADRRAAILAAWSSSPTRFREDANAEEDLALGGYADRLLTELLANAADAATRAATPGTVTVRLTGDTLTVANTGTPLTAAGVDSLTSLRASAKRDDAGRSDEAAPVPAGVGTVGRFGVGFAAVLAVSDEPEVRSTTGGVRFSAARTREAVAGIPHLADELARRGGRVPVLRLPWPVTEAPPAGCATEVRLPLRDAAAVEAVRVALATFDPSLLLALPPLATVELPDRAITRTAEPPDVIITDAGTATRWRTAGATGPVPPALLADRPVEERSLAGWHLLAAVPVVGDLPQPLPQPQLLHAPTPTTEPLDLPLRLLGTFPLDPTRQHIPDTPLTAHLATQAGPLLADLVTLVAARAPDPAVLTLIPHPTFTATALSAAVRTTFTTALRTRPFLPTAAGPEAVDASTDLEAVDLEAAEAGAGRPGWVVPERAVAVPDAVVEALAGVVDGLLPAGWWRHDTAAALAGLGVQRLGVAEVVSLVSGLSRPPSWWRGLYAALAAATAEPGPSGAADLGDWEALAALPVPLTDGRTVTGPAGLLLPGEGLPAGLSALGLRIAHPEAVHPVLARLGATETTPRTLLADPRVRAAVTSSLPDLEDTPADLAGQSDLTDSDGLVGPAVVDAVLRLVGAAGVRPGEEPWLEELALPGRPLGEPGAEPEWWPAGELLLPGGRLAAVLDPDAPFGVVEADVVAGYGRDVLVAVGVLDTFAEVDEADLDLTEVGELDLDGGEEWADMAAAVAGIDVGGWAEHFQAVRDLEWVRDDAWGAALALLGVGTGDAGTGRELRDARDLDDVGYLRGAGSGARVGGCRVSGPGIEAVVVPGYTRWWLGRHPVLGGRRPGELRVPGESELAGLYDEAPGDPGVAAALGAWRGLPDLLAAAADDPAVAADLLERLGDPDRTVEPELLAVVYPRLAAALARGGRAATGADRGRPLGGGGAGGGGAGGGAVGGGAVGGGVVPERVRVAPEVVVAAERVAVIDRPWLLDRLGDRYPVAGGGDPVAVAELLDVPLLSELPSDG